jgi:hypothetical protein
MLQTALIAIAAVFLVKFILNKVAPGLASNF